MSMSALVMVHRKVKAFKADPAIIANLMAVGQAVQEAGQTDYPVAATELHPHACKHRRRALHHRCVRMLEKLTGRLGVPSLTIRLQCPRQLC